MTENNVSSIYTRAITHAAMHIIAGLALAATVTPLTAETTIIAGLASLLPDADADLGIPHRTATHSIAAIATIYVSTYAAAATPTATIAALAGYISHIVVDLMHGHGVQLLWPARIWLHVSSGTSLPAITTIAGLALAATIAAPTPPLAAIITTPTATPTPTTTPTPTATATATATATPTPTTTPTPTATADIWRITELRLQWLRADAAAAHTCRIYGLTSQRCTDARYAADIEHAQYCHAAIIAPDCATATPTPTSTATPTLESCYTIRNDSTPCAPPPGSEK